MKKLFIFICLWLTIQGCFAVTKTAVVDNGNWATAATWSPAGAPAAGDDVIIPNGITVVLEANMATAINTLTIQNGGRLNGNNKQFNNVTTSIIIDAGGTMNAISSISIPSTLIMQELLL
jgi:uncharacterized protein YceK